MTTSAEAAAASGGSGREPFIAVFHRQPSQSSSSSHSSPSNNTSSSSRINDTDYFCSPLSLSVSKEALKTAAAVPSPSKSVAWHSSHKPKLAALFLPPPGGAAVVHGHHRFPSPLTSSCSPQVLSVMTWWRTQALAVAVEAAIA
jgi:hypothetical protein